MTHHLPVGVQFEKRVNQWGGIFITVPGDITEYYIDKQQRWLPHEIEDTTHPAKVGDMVTLTPWLAKRLGVSVAFVSGVRTFKSSKKSNGVRLVEFLGLPCQWFSIGHVDEYRGLQITDHIWGNYANRETVDGKVVPIVPADGKVRLLVKPNL